MDTHAKLKKFLEKKLKHPLQAVKPKLNFSNELLTQAKVQELVTKFKRRIYPTSEAKKMRFERNFAYDVKQNQVFKEMDTFLPVSEIIKSEAKQPIYIPSHNHKVARTRMEEYEKPIKKDELLEYTHKFLQDKNHVFRSQQQFIANELISQIEQQTQRHYSDADSQNDDFYDRVEEYLTKLTAPTQEDEQIERPPQKLIQVSFIFLRRTALPEYHINLSKQSIDYENRFKAKTNELIKFLRAATQKIYQQKVEAQKTEEKQIKQQIRLVRDKILNRKNPHLRQNQNKLNDQHYEIRINPQSKHTPLKQTQTEIDKSSQSLQIPSFEFKTQPEQEITSTESNRFKSKLPIIQHHNPQPKQQSNSSKQLTPLNNNLSPMKISKKPGQYKSGSFVAINLQSHQNILAVERKRFSELMSDIQYFQEEDQLTQHKSKRFRIKHGPKLMNLHSDHENNQESVFETQT